MSPSAANLRGKLAALIVDREELGREMDAAVSRDGRIGFEDAEDYRHRMDDLDQRIHHLRHELAKTTDD